MRLPDLISNPPAKPMLQDAPFPALEDEQQPFPQPPPDHTLAAPPSEGPVGGEPAMQLRPIAAPPQMLAAYQENLDIMRKLAALDQRNVSVSLVELGDVKLQAGDHAGALVAYQESLDILRKLATQDPSNAEAQRDLASNPERLVQRDLMVCYSRLAGVYLKEQQLAQASENLAAGHSIASRLVANFPDWAEGKEAIGWFDQNIAALPEK